MRVTRTTICGSDLHLVHGLVPDLRVGTVLGHECTGVVEEVGDRVTRLEPGDRVVVPFNVSCGACFFCQRGLFANCDNANPSTSVAGGALGYSHTTGGYDGSQAEYLRVPYADIGPVRIPAGLDDEQVLFLSDILPTGYQAAEMGDVREGETVAVFGCGPVGLIAQRCAWLLGAGRVIGVDHVGYRLDFARDWAGSETIDFSDRRDAVAEILERTGGRGADVCIDAVGLEAAGSTWQRALGLGLKLTAGAATALAWAIQAARKGGRVSVVGVYGPPWNLVPIGTAMNKGLTLRMNQCNVRRYVPRLLEHIQAGRLDTRPLITHRFALSEAPEAYEIFSEKRDGCIKAVLVPPLATA